MTEIIILYYYYIIMTEIYKYFGRKIEKNQLFFLFFSIKKKQRKISKRYKYNNTGK